MALHNILSELLALALLLNAVPSRAQDTDELCSADGIAGVRTSIASLNAVLQRLNSEVPGLETDGGVVYTRWGRTTCPDTATLVYEGVMGNSHYNQGGGVNYQCLPLDPEFDGDSMAGDQGNGAMYGVEYESVGGSPFFSGVHNTDAPCAVCEVDGRSKQLMIPAKKSCPTGWTLEYDGMLASTRYYYRSSEYICVSSDMESVPNSGANHNGGLLYVVEAQCGSLPCDDGGYVNGYELTCAVCTK